MASCREASASGERRLHEGDLGQRTLPAPGSACRDVTSKGGTQLRKQLFLVSASNLICSTAPLANDKKPGIRVCLWPEWFPS